MPYADLELTITATGGAHELRMRLARPGDAGFRLGEPHPVALDREALRARGAEGPGAYGEALAAMLFAPPAAAEFTRLRAAARGAGERVRVRLVLPDDLHALRWETLPDPASGRALALDGDLLLSRYLGADDDQPVVLRPRGRLRALVAVAAPRDYHDYRLAEIKAGEETAPVLAALEALRPAVITATWSALDTALREGCDILYLLAHGVLSGESPYLYLVDDDGNADRRSGKALADLLRGLGARAPRLVVLASCESAGDGYADALAALGPRLARAGVPAVLAMQGRFSITTNQTFAPAFFRELLRDGAVDRAANSARLAVADRDDWWMPALYTRLGEGVIWREEQGGPAVAYDSLRQLRAPVADFVGREREIAALIAALAGGGGATIGGLAGMGGIGKIELAMKVADVVRERYPDAQIVLNLQGSREPALTAAQALQGVIRAFLPEARLPDDEASLLAAYRGVLAGKRALILADDARDAAQVRPLAPPPGSALLVTTRYRFELPGMATRVLDELPEDDAVRLLQTISPAIGDGEAREIAGLCGRLPLALRVVAGLTKKTSRSVAEYIGLLRDERGRLGRLVDTKAELNVEATLSLSYALLDPADQGVFALLGVMAASFAREAALDVLALEDPEQGVDHLDRLIEASLLEFDPEQRRYDLHELVRVFALARLREREGAERAARLRHARHYIAVAERAERQFLGGGDGVVAGLALFDRERANLDAARRWLQSLAGDAEADGLLIADADATVYCGDLRYDKRLERIPQFAAALAAARRLGRRDAQGRFLGNLGIAHRNLGKVRRAIELYEQHLTVARELGDRRGEGSALGNLGLAYTTLGEARRAIELYEQHLTVAREIGDRRGEANSAWNLGLLLAREGDAPRALPHLELGLAFYEELGHPRAAGMAELVAHVRAHGTLPG